jgi:hypothetical protein
MTNATHQAIPWELMSPNRPICRALSHTHCVNALEAMRLRQNSAPAAGHAGGKASAAQSSGPSVDGGCFEPKFFMVYSSSTTDVSELQVICWSRSDVPEVSDLFVGSIFSFFSSLTHLFLAAKVPCQRRHPALLEPHKFFDNSSNPCLMPMRVCLLIFF